jgi:RNA polymerase primary sigma factor
MDVSGLTKYLKAIGKQPPLDKEEELELSRIIKRQIEESDQAKKVMIEANLRLVVAIAKENQYRGLDLEDLISEGNIGLMKAIDRFDPNQGNKLSTYASWWIRQQMQLAITEQAKTIRMPPHAADKLRKIRKIINELTTELGRSPSIEEISEETSLSIKKIEEIIGWGNNLVSLDNKESEESSSMETFIDSGVTSPLDNLLRKSDAQWVNNIMSALEPREREIIQRRFGIGKKERLTLEEIGEEFGVTRERIRQLEQRAMRKLRRKLSKLSILEEGNPKKQKDTKNSGI